MLERLEVEQVVGRGAAGIVFKAHDRREDRQIALKVIAVSDAVDEERHRILDEGAILGELDHPSIVRIVDYGTLGEEEAELCGERFEPDTPFIAMEWLEGCDLQERHSAHPLSLRESLECMRQLASALSAAHESGILHRDVKPSNVFVVSNDNGARFRVKLVDFGVACAAPEEMSAVGAVVGTPAYMAPEQARGDAQIDQQCDVYAMGATLFELIAGRPPHVGPNTVALLAKLVTTPAQRLSELVLDVPEELDQLVAEMLEMDSKQRPSTRDVEQRLEALCQNTNLPRLASAIERQQESVHSSVSRVMTTLVALNVARGDERDEQIARMREMGAETVPLGQDAVVAYLGARRAHGGEASRAIEIGKLLVELGAAVGVATGRAHVELARPVGEVVDRASALAREAIGGQILADETTADLARSDYAFEPRSSRYLVGAATAERRQAMAMTPFVGRDNEIARLHEAFRQCLDEQRPVLISASGPPGIGKSRLAREFIEQLRQGKHGGEVPRVVQVHCDAYGRARALGTVGDALTDLMNIPKGARSYQVANTLEAFKLVHEEKGLLASLLAGEPFPQDVDPNRARDILYLAMTELIFKIVQEDPCIILLEDLQWSDRESVTWFSHLMSRAAGRRIFMFVVTRPSFWKDHPEAFSQQPHQRVELRPIGRQATMSIARRVIGENVTQAKLDQIAEQAAGSPLFAEELARVMATGKAASTVPTIEAAIQVSLDALTPDARDALLQMSVLGIAVWDDALRSLGVERVDKSLELLLKAEIIVQHLTSRFPDTREFWIKHALVRDVAYASLSDAMRMELHAKAANWLARIGEDAATVAEHYNLGGEQAMAAGYWERAARRALTANALPDAVRMADQALTFATESRTIFSRATLLDEVYSRLDERAAERSEAIEAMEQNAYDEASEVRALGACARYDHARSAGSDVEERLVEAARRSAALGLLDEQARCVATLATRFAYAGELGQAETEAERLLELSKNRGVFAAAVDAWQTLAVVRQTRGELEAALEARRNAARAARAAGLKQREAMLTINLGFALTTIGAKDEARKEIESGIEMADEIGSAGTVRLGRMIMLGWAAHFGSEPSLDEQLEAARSTADDASAGGWIVKDRVTLGVLFYRGCELLTGDQARVSRACSLLELSAEAYRQTDNRDVLPVALGYWAEGLRRLGQVERAEKIACEAAELVESGAPSLLNESIIYMALHGARVDLGDLPGARRAIERAMPALIRRVNGLRGTSYAKGFLLSLSHNAHVIEAADALGCLPTELAAMLGE